MAGKIAYLLLLSSETIEAFEKLEIHLGSNEDETLREILSWYHNDE